MAIFACQFWKKIIKDIFRICLKNCLNDFSTAVPSGTLRICYKYLFLNNIVQKKRVRKISLTRVSKLEVNALTTLNSLTRNRNKFLCISYFWLDIKEINCQIIKENNTDVKLPSSVYLKYR